MARTEGSNALGLDPDLLDAVQKEGTAVLPGLNFSKNQQ
jgi:hypothetical protein